MLVLINHLHLHLQTQVRRGDLPAPSESILLDPVVINIYFSVYIYIYVCNHHPSLPNSNTQILNIGTQNCQGHSDYTYVQIFKKI